LVAGKEVILGVQCGKGHWKMAAMGDQSGLENYFDEFSTSLKDCLLMYLYLIEFVLGFWCTDAIIRAPMYF